jgi:phosphatidylglycerophosphate synthase
MFSLLSGTPTEAPRRVPNDLHARTAGELAPAYIAKLRKTEPPYLFFPVVEADAARIEEHAFRASYKGLTDLITRWVWPVPALATVRVLARRGVHPNTVTLLSWALAALTFVWFWQGSFGLGLAAAWLMTFLDTVDGKLARCTLTSSRLGDVLDHGLDLTHPPFWWFAWGFGLPAGVGLATVITVAGYFIGRALEGIFLAAFKFETHSWREIDGLFRTVTARRNPNLLLLSVGVLGGRPDLGMKMVAIWTVVSIAFHGWRLGLAFAERARGAEIRPFGEAPELPMRQSRAGAESGVGMSRL